ncbi:CPBP family intramembrane glutamic endopeptidase [Halosimplex aquaticum]
MFLLLIPLSFLVVGPGEELLYRGLVQGTLRETLHPARAIVLASALFASIHLFSLTGEGKLVYVGIAFALPWYWARPTSTPTTSLSRP